jgi:hypothetical protein
MRRVIVTALALVLVLPGLAADPTQAVKEFVTKNMADAGQLTAVQEESLNKAFPQRAFYSLRFRQFPIALRPPAGLTSSNVLAVDGDKVDSLTTGAELEKFATRFLTAKDEASAKVAVKAYLALLTEQAQDGFYKFDTAGDVPRTMKEGDKLTVRGKSVVKEGGEGDISVQLDFDAAGKLVAVAVKDSLKRGARPKVLGD